MSHTVHTTRAFVLGSADVQEADKLFWLLTEDLGLLFASAKSVREETSKLRYALQDVSPSRVSLVRGRGLWRLTGAEVHGGPKLKLESAKVLGRIATLVRRVMPTDEENLELFVIVNGAYAELAKEDVNMELIEHVTVARVLYQLGYLSCTHAYRGVVDTANFDDIVAGKWRRSGQQLLHDINRGVAESQL